MKRFLIGVFVTLISLSPTTFGQISLPVLTPGAVPSVLGSILDRISHEELLVLGAGKMPGGVEPLVAKFF